MKNMFNNVVYLFSFFRKDNINEYFYRITHPHVHMSMFTTHDNNATMPFTTSQNKMLNYYVQTWKEVMYFFYVLIYLKFTPLKTWFFNFSFHQYSLFYLYFLKTKAFGNLSKKMCWGGLDQVIFDTFFWQATGSLRYTTGCLCTQQEAGA